MTVGGCVLGYEKEDAAGALLTEALNIAHT
jgi:hypothetical protein